MNSSLPMLRPSCEGGKLIYNGNPVFWSPGKSAALEVANTIAEARHTHCQCATGVEVERECRSPERVSSYG